MKPEENNCLSFGDALFLHLEREGMPLHIASLSTFEGKISLEDCTRFIASKLPLVPRYFQRVVPAPFDLGLPSWQNDRHFNIRNHVREIALKHGTEAEMKAVASRILSVTMDRSRPLWDFTLLQGLKGNRTGILTRVHHCLADGISGVGLMNAIMAASPSAVPPKAPKSKARPRPQPEPSAAECLLESCISTVQRALTVETELLIFAQRVLAAAAANGSATAQSVLENGNHPNGGLPSVDELNQLLPELFSPAERLPFNVVCRGPQKFECTEIPLDQLRAVKHACGVTLNDVLLSLVTSAVRQYAQMHRVPLRGRSLRIVVPVSLRDKHAMRELGNHISFVPVMVPMGFQRVRSVVDAVHEHTMLLKRTHLAELVGLAGSLLGAIPVPVQAAVGPIASQLPLSVCNLICTDVPGPKVPLYLMGHRMLTCAPYVPIGGEMGMNIAILTYNNTAYFGFTGDVHAVPDLHLFPRLLLKSFAELQDQTRVRSRRRHAAAAPSVQPESVPGGTPEEAMAYPPKETRLAEEPEKTIAAAVGAA